MKLSIYTFSMGRERYLEELILSIHGSSLRLQDFELEHHVCFQGTKPSENYEAIVSLHSNITTYVWDKNIGIANGMNKILPLLSGDFIVKMDDDCLPLSTWKRPTFLEHIVQISKNKPMCVWSPYPVGLINNPGGPKGFGHEILRIEKPWDSIYTLRRVNHVGGFCRISPRITKDWIFEDDLKPGQSGNEDVQFSKKCKEAGIPMFYTENGPIIEHNESTFGQHERYGSEYFNGRF